ncbi:MAG: hypothetical protein M3230_06750, partial [Thermoproteota archaeon]|nr:hypothetical protein [Thermoproteota archaeon]
SHRKIIMLAKMLCTLCIASAWYLVVLSILADLELNIRYLLGDPCRNRDNPKCKKSSSRAF